MQESYRSSVIRYPICSFLSSLDYFKVQRKKKKKTLPRKLILEIIHLLSLKRIITLELLHFCYSVSISKVTIESDINYLSQKIINA